MNKFLIYKRSFGPQEQNIKLQQHFDQKKKKESCNSTHTPKPNQPKRNLYDNTFTRPYTKLNLTKKFSYRREKKK